MYIGGTGYFGVGYHGKDKGTLPMKTKWTSMNVHEYMYVYISMYVYYVWLWDTLNFLYWTFIKHFFENLDFESTLFSKGVPNFVEKMFIST